MPDESRDSRPALREPRGAIPPGCSPCGHCRAITRWVARAVLLELGAGVAQSRLVDPFEEAFTRAKEDRRNGDVHLVDRALAKMLLNDIDAATNANIVASGRFSRLRQGGGNAIGDEAEGVPRSMTRREAWAWSFSGGERGDRAVAGATRDRCQDARPEWHKIYLTARRGPVARGWASPRPRRRAARRTQDACC